MNVSKSSGRLIATILAAGLLAACMANGGSSGSGSGGSDNGGLAACTSPFGGDGAKFVTAHASPDCVSCGVANPENVIDGNPDTFATMTMTTLLSGSVHLMVLVDDPASPNPDGLKYPAGNVAAFVLSVPTPLVSADLLPTFSVVTKLDNVVQEEHDQNVVLDAQALALINSGRFLFGFRTTKDFDSMEFKITAGAANLLDTVDVHAACANATAPADFTGGLVI